MEYVRYIGPSQTRLILADEWAAAGIPDMGSVEWSAANNFSVPVDRFTEDALDKAIRPDAGFVIVGGEHHAPKYVGRAGTLTPEQAAGMGRVDMMGATGATSVPAWLSGPSTGADNTDTDVATRDGGVDDGSAPMVEGTPGGSSPTTVATGTGSANDAV